MKMPKPRKSLNRGHEVKYRIGMFPHKATFETPAFANIFKRHLREMGVHLSHHVSIEDEDL